MDESLKKQIHEECRIRNRSEGTCKNYTYLSDCSSRYLTAHSNS